MRWALNKVLLKLSFRFTALSGFTSSAGLYDRRSRMSTSYSWPAYSRRVAWVRWDANPRVGGCAAPGSGLPVACCLHGASKHQLTKRHGRTGLGNGWPSFTAMAHSTPGGLCGRPFYGRHIKRHFKKTPLRHFRTTSSSWPRRLRSAYAPRQKADPSYLFAPPKIPKRPAAQGAGEGNTATRYPRRRGAPVLSIACCLPGASKQQLTKLCGRTGLGNGWPSFTAMAHSTRPFTAITCPDAVAYLGRCPSTAASAPRSTCNPALLLGTSPAFAAVGDVLIDN
jgi:hypothetical protein